MNLNGEKYFHEYIKNWIEKCNIREAYKYLGGLISFVLLTVQDMEIAIQYGIDPRYDGDMLFTECCSTNIDLIKYFLSCGCDINAKNSKALCKSIQCGQFETAKFLLENGSNVTDQVITEACKNGHQYIKLLIKHGIDPERVMKLYFKNMDSETIKTLKFFDSMGMDIMTMICQ